MVTTLTGTLLRSAVGGAVLPALSPQLSAFDGDIWPPHNVDMGRGPRGITTDHFPVAANAGTIVGTVLRSYHDDYYYRVHVRPAQIDLGNLITAQTRSVEVWNAWPTRALSLDSLDVVGGDGIVLTGDDTRPLGFLPLQARTWSVAVTSNGPATIAAQLRWLFAGEQPAVATITGNRLIAWMLPPDWARPVVETLAWLTDVQESCDGSEYREPCRDTPRRAWEFDVLAEGQDRQQVEAALYDWMARNWVLPVWVDITWLSSAILAGANTIAVETAGLDFVVGSLVALWSDPRTYELIEIAAVTAHAITLAHPTANAWPAQTRLYPCRISRLTDAPKLTRHTDRLISTTARFESVEPCDWTAVAPTATYRGLPVLEDRPDESDDPSAAYDRQLATMDGDVGLVFVDDLSGIAWPTQSHAWWLAGHAARVQLRSLLYWLAGRANALWVPSWTDDLIVTQPMAGGATVLTVAWIGVTRHLHRQPGRRHLRIELVDGRVFYRAVTDSAEVDAATERLVLDSSLGVDLTASMVRQINWLMLCRLASDTVQISHVTDHAGTANCAVNWAGVGAEEP